MTPYRLGRGLWWLLPCSPGGSAQGLCPRGSQMGAASRTDKNTWHDGHPSEPRGGGISWSRTVSWDWGHPGWAGSGGSGLGVGVVHSTPNCPPVPFALCQPARSPQGPQSRASAPTCDNLSEQLLLKHPHAGSVGTAPAATYQAGATVIVATPRPLLGGVTLRGQKAGRRSTKRALQQVPPISSAPPHRSSQEQKLPF